MPIISNSCKSTLMLSYEDLAGVSLLEGSIGPSPRYIGAVPLYIGAAPPALYRHREVLGGKAQTTVTKANCVCGKYGPMEETEQFQVGTKCGNINYGEKQTGVGRPFQMAKAVKQKKRRPDILRKCRWCL